mgnify:CR=1 FL=1
MEFGFIGGFPDALSQHDLDFAQLVELTALADSASSGIGLPIPIAHGVNVEQQGVRIAGTWQLLNRQKAREALEAAVAERVAALLEFPGKLEFDANRPDGKPQKLLDSSRIHALGWKPATALDDGIRLAYADFRKRYGEKIAGAVHG